MQQKIGQMIGHGFEGKVFASSQDNKRVIKEIALKKSRNKRQIDMTEQVIGTIEIMKLASANDIGPEVYDIFYNQDKSKVYIEMERVEVIEPTSRDVDKIIELYEKMLRKKFVTFDFQFAKRIYGEKRGQWVMIDYGVVERYESYKDALRGLIENDLLADTGLGYYNAELERHFMEKMQKRKY